MVIGIEEFNILENSIMINPNDELTHFKKLFKNFIISNKNCMSKEYKKRKEVR